MIIQMFIHFENNDYTVLLSKYKDETMVRVFLDTQIKSSIKKEVSEIIEAEFKTIEALSNQEKL